MADLAAEARALAERHEGRTMNGGNVIQGMHPMIYETADLLRRLADEADALSARLAQLDDENELLSSDLNAMTRAKKDAEARLREYEEALRGVSNAYGCFAGCTGALAGAPEDGSGHTPACRAARAALAGGTDD